MRSNLIYFYYRTVWVTNTTVWHLSQASIGCLCPLHIPPKEAKNGMYCMQSLILNLLFFTFHNLVKSWREEKHQFNLSRSTLQCKSCFRIQDKYTAQKLYMLSEHWQVAGAQKVHCITVQNPACMLTMQKVFVVSHTNDRRSRLLTLSPLRKIVFSYTVVNRFTYT